MDKQFKGYANLFNVKSPVANGPAMDGQIKADDAAEGDKGIRIAAFGKKAESCGSYFSLSIGDKENRLYGALFTNSKKEKPEQPDYTGRIELSKEEGDVLFIAGWNKTGDKAGAFISLKIQPPAPKGAPEAAEQQAALEEDFPV